MCGSVVKCGEGCEIKSVGVLLRFEKRRSPTVFCFCVVETKNGGSACARSKNVLLLSRLVSISMIWGPSVLGGRRLFRRKYFLRISSAFGGLI